MLEWLISLFRPKTYPIETFRRVREIRSYLKNISYLSIITENQYKVAYVSYEAALDLLAQAEIYVGENDYLAGYLREQVNASMTVINLNYKKNMV